MGHLSNPIGVRLGLEKVWKFTFFVKNIYYPEVINNFINMRDYVYYYFTRKKMLKSGLCFSHLFLYKYLKKLYFDIYIYHTELESISYDYLNHIFEQYYSVYNKYKYKKKKTSDELNNFYNMRDLSNSDLFVFYYTYVHFFNQGRKKYLTNYLKRNLYITDENVKSYSFLLITFYIQKWLYHFWSKSILFKTVKWRNDFFKYKLSKKYKKQKYHEKQQFIERRKIFNWVKHSVSMKQACKLKLKLKKRRLLRQYFKKILEKKWLEKDKSLKGMEFYLSGIGNVTKKQIMDHEKEQFEERLTRAIKKEPLHKVVIRYLDKYLKKFLWNENRKIFFSIFFKIKKSLSFSKIKKWKLYKLRRWIFKSRKAFWDLQFVDRYNKLYFDWTHYSKLKKFKVIDLLFYFAKKVGFKKYKHSKTLWKKWSIIYKYFKIMDGVKGLSRSRFIFSIKNFFFYLNTFIHLSKKGLQRNNYFNFRNSIYSSLYFGIFNNHFYKILKMITSFLKYHIEIIGPGINKKNIYFKYIFITNNNVSSQLISRYLALKFKRGYMVRRVLSPLKRELVRVSKQYKRNQKPFIIYNYKLMLKNKVLFFARIIKKYVALCYIYFFFNYLKNYINNGIFIYFFMFKWMTQKFNRWKRNNFMKNYYMDMLYNKVENYSRIMHYKKYRISKLFSSVIWKKRKRLFLRIKKYYINIMYASLFNFDQKSNWDQWYERNNDIIIFKNAFLNSFKLWKASLFNKYTMIKKINNGAIYISSFFNKNIFNFKILKILFLIYKNINLRNIRQQFIPPYYSNIMGFKMIFKGRFSRKDRASKMVLLMGKVPLNNININVDYNLITMPIKNSVISIKVFIYRIPVVQKYKNIVII